MKTAHISLIVVILGILLTSCTKSLQNDKRYTPFIGKKFRTRKDLFLVESPDEYSLEGERKMAFFRDSKPTFDEFKNGVWVDKIKEKKYRLIIPAETEVQLVDIVHVTNWEAGDTLCWYGNFVSPPKGVDLKKKILLDAHYGDSKDPAPLVPPFIREEEGYRPIFIPADKIESISCLSQ